MVGASRERVNKAIATFVRLGWLAVRGRDALPHPRPRRARSPHASRCQLRLRQRRSRASSEPGERGSRARPRRRPGARDDRGRGRSRDRRPRRRRSRSRARPAHAARSASMSAGGRQRVDRTEDRERRAHVGRGVEGSSAGRRPSSLGQPDHPVERDRAVETIGRGGLRARTARPCRSRARRPCDAVFDDEQVGRRREVAELRPRRRDSRPSPSAPRRRKRPARLRPRGRTARPPRPRSRATRAASPWSSNSGRKPMMSGCRTTPAIGMPSGRAWTTGTDRVARGQRCASRPRASRDGPGRSQRRPLDRDATRSARGSSSRRCARGRP